MKTTAVKTSPSVVATCCECADPASLRGRAFGRPDESFCRRCWYRFRYHALTPDELIKVRTAHRERQRAAATAKRAAAAMEGEATEHATANEVVPEIAERIEAASAARLTVERQFSPPLPHEPSEPFANLIRQWRALRRRQCRWKPDPATLRAQQIAIKGVGSYRSPAQQASAKKCKEADSCTRKEASR